MAAYTIHIAAPGVQISLNPDKITGLTGDLPVDMQDLVRAIVAAPEAALLDATTTASLVPMPLEGANTQVIPPETGETLTSLVHRIYDWGTDYLKDRCVIRVIPSRLNMTVGDTGPCSSQPAMFRNEDGSLQIHRGALHQIRTKLGTLHLEVSEALAALDDFLTAKKDMADDSIFLPLPEVDLGDALLHLGRLDRSSLSSAAGVFEVRDILSQEQRDDLQTITHTLRNVDDGLGHTTQDSTAANLMREHQGAEEGDLHEKLMAQANLTHKHPGAEMNLQRFDCQNEDPNK